VEGTDPNYPSGYLDDNFPATAVKEACYAPLINLAVHPAGRFLYGSGPSGLYGYTLDAANGTPSSVNSFGNFLAPTTNAKRILIDPAGCYLWVLGVGGLPTLTQLRIDSGTGMLNIVGSAMTGLAGMGDGFLAIVDTP